MVQILRALVPVLGMLALGMLLRSSHVLSDRGVGELKTLLTRFLLPAAIFHALATASYSAGTLLTVGIMFAMMALSFGIGYLLRPLVSQPFRKYVPFMVSVYEGGMVAYPLYTQLCGAGALSHIALLDIAGLLFGFSVYMSLLSFTESGEKPTPGAIARSALHSPPFLAAVLGVAAGVSGLFPAFLSSDAGLIYLAAEETLTAPLSAMILLVVGCSIRFQRELVKPCLVTVALRAGLQALLITLTLPAIRRVSGQDMLTDLAVLLYMSAPATFSMQSFVRDPAGSSYVSNANALYCFVSVAVFAVCAALYPVG